MNPIDEIGGSDTKRRKVYSHNVTFTQMNRSFTYEEMMRNALQNHNTPICVPRSTLLTDIDVDPFGGGIKDDNEISGRE